MRLWTGPWTAIWTKFWTHFEHCSCTSKPGLWPGSLAGSLLNSNGEVLGAGFMLSVKHSCYQVVVEALL